MYDNNRVYYSVCIYYLLCLDNSNNCKKYIVMEKYIKKSALVAEIDKLVRKNELYLDDNVSDAVRFQKTGAYSVLCDLRYFIDTLEVKDADIENVGITEWNDYVKKIDGDPDYAYMLIERGGYIALAKHFYELGLKAQKGE